MQERFQNLLSRKFIAFMCVLWSAHLLVDQKLIADGVYSAVVIAAIGAYIVGNVAQKRMQKAGKQPATAVGE